MPPELSSPQQLALGEDKSVFAVLAHLFSTRPCLERPRTSLARTHARMRNLRDECLGFARTMDDSENLADREAALARIRDIRDDMQGCRREIEKFRRRCQNGQALYACATAYLLRFVASSADATFRERSDLEGSAVFSKVSLFTTYALNEGTNKKQPQADAVKDMDPAIKARSVTDQSNIAHFLLEHIRTLTQIHASYSADFRGIALRDFSRLLNDTSCADGMAVAEIFSLAGQVQFQLGSGSSGDAAKVQRHQSDALEDYGKEEEGQGDHKKAIRESEAPLQLNPSQFIDALVRVAHAKFSLQETTLFHCVRTLFEDRLLKLPMNSANWLLTILASSDAKIILGDVKIDLERIFQHHANAPEHALSLTKLASMVGALDPSVGNPKEEQSIIQVRLEEALAVLRREISPGKVGGRNALVDPAMCTRLLCAEALRRENSPFVEPCRRLRVFLSRFIGVHKR